MPTLALVSFASKIISGLSRQLEAACLQQLRQTERTGIIKPQFHKKPQGSVNTPTAPWLSTLQQCPRVPSAFVPEVERAPLPCVQLLNYIT